jgi:hypothetical protein
MDIIIIEMKILGLRGQNVSPPGRAAAPFLANPLFEKEGRP